MKLAFAILMCMAAGAFAASPSFTSFDPTFFDVTGNRVTTTNGAKTTNLNTQPALLINNSSGANSCMISNTGAGSLRIFQNTLGLRYELGGSFFHSYADTANIFDYTVQASNMLVIAGMTNNGPSVLNGTNTIGKTLFSGNPGDGVQFNLPTTNASSAVFQNGVKVDIGTITGNGTNITGIAGTSVGFYAGANITLTPRADNGVTIASSGSSATNFYPDTTQFKVTLADTNLHIATGVALTNVVVNSSNGVASLTINGGLTFGINTNNYNTNMVVDLAKAVQTFFLTNNSSIIFSNVTPGATTLARIVSQTNASFTFIITNGVTLLSGSLTNVLNTNKTAVLSVSSFGSSIGDSNLCVGIAIQP